MTFLYHCFLTSAAAASLGFLIIIGAGKDAKQVTMAAAGALIMTGVTGVIISAFVSIWYL